MKEIKRDRLVQDTDILLFDILHELKKMNLRSNLLTIPVYAPEPVEKVKGFKCKYCGGTHEKAWQIGICGKNSKKEGAK